MSAVPNPGSLRRHRIAVAGIAALAAAALAAGAAAVAGYDWARAIGDGFGTFYESDSSPAVTGSFPSMLSCDFGRGGVAQCGAAKTGTQPASAYLYERVTRVTPDTSGGIGGGTVDAEGRALRPPTGIPPWIACRAEAGGYACAPFQVGESLPVGTPIYELDPGAWVLTD